MKENSIVTNKKKEEVRLVNLTQKNQVWYLEDTPIHWLKWPFKPGGNGVVKAWALYQGEDFEGLYMSLSQCCTSLLVCFCYGAPGEIFIAQLPNGIERLEIDFERLNTDSERIYFLATGKACNGNGTVRIYSNLAYGEWEWVKKI